eukprot:1520064-Prymnesium_polylepis.1
MIRSVPKDLRQGAHIPAPHRERACREWLSDCILFYMTSADFDSVVPDFPKYYDESEAAPLAVYSPPVRDRAAAISLEQLCTITGYTRCMPF